MTRSLIALTLCGLFATGAALAADDAALRRCRALADAPARLACYDALPLGAAAAAATAAAPGAQTMGTPPVAAAAPAATPATFGLEQQRAELPEINSRIAGRFEGWGPRSRIRLANGQLWQVSDDSSGVYDLMDPKVTVRRATLGSFILEIEGARRAPRVRRVE
ncbi:MAG: hypothetical protein Q8K96_05485 [Rubrivivax sp.]|nr:hypothetical protein [Rubrivivax sp.]